MARLIERLEGQGSRLVLAVAGGINRGNIALYARTGAEIVVTSSPYHAPPRDVAVVLEPA